HRGGGSGSGHYPLDGAALCGRRVPLYRPAACDSAGQEGAAGERIRRAGVCRIALRPSWLVAVGRFGMLLTIKHTTTYRYGRPVTLLPHRLMLIPRSNHTLNLRSTRVSTSPPAEIEWS